MAIATGRTVPLAEACRRLGLSPAQGYRLVWSGELEATREGRNWRVPAEAIEEHLQRGGNDD